MMEYIKNNKIFLLHLVSLLLFIFYIAYVSSSPDNFLWDMNSFSTIEIVVEKQPDMRSFDCVSYFQGESISGNFFEITFKRGNKSILVICSGKIKPLCVGADNQLTILEQADFDRHFFSQLSLLGHATQQYRTPKKVTFHYLCTF